MSVSEGMDRVAVDTNPGAHRSFVASQTALWCLVKLSAFHQRSVDPDQLVRSLGFEHRVIGIPELLIACGEIGLKSKSVMMDWTDLSRLVLPAMAELSSGEFVIIGKMTPDGRLPVTSMGSQKPSLFDQAQWENIASGQILLIKERLSASNPNRTFGLSWFIPVFKKYRKELIEVLVAAFLFQLLGVGVPLFVQVIIDKVFVYQNYATLTVVAAGMFIVILFNGIFAILQSLLLAHVGNRIDVTLGSAVYRRLVRIPLRYFEQRRIGDTTARVREMEPLRNFLTGQALLSLVDGLFIFIYIGLLLFYSFSLTCVVLIAMVTLATTTGLFRPALRARLEQKFDNGADNQAFLVESVTGMETVKAMALEANMVQRWDRLLARYVTSAYRSDRLGSFARGIGTTLQNLTTLAILWFGARLVLSGQLTVGALIAFQMLSSRAMAPMMRISSLWQQFQQVGISIRRLGDLMNAPVEPVMDASRSTLPPLKGGLQFDNVAFRYHQDLALALDNISFEVEPGTTVGVVGRSGSGKSTLAKLMQRLYLAEQGRILFDEHDVQQVDPGWLRRQIAVVPQESFLFGGTLRENIAVRFPSAPMNHIVEVAKLAGAHEFITQLPHGYDTQVGERGAALSGGQRQRIAIARALITNPRILILDEATSALDYESERIIQDNLAHIARGRTVIIIAHRLSILRQAGQILVLEQGRLAEQGTHDELIDLGGLYRHLYKQQGLAP